MYDDKYYVVLYYLIVLNYNKSNGLLVGPFLSPNLMKFPGKNDYW